MSDLWQREMCTFMSRLYADSLPKGNVVDEKNLGAKDFFPCKELSVKYPTIISHQFEVVQPNQTCLNHHALEGASMIQYAQLAAQGQFDFACDKMFSKAMYHIVSYHYCQQVLCKHASWCGTCTSLLTT